MTCKSAIWLVLLHIWVSISEVLVLLLAFMCFSSTYLFFHPVFLTAQAIQLINIGLGLAREAFYLKIYFLHIYRSFISKYVHYRCCVLFDLAQRYRCIACRAWTIILLTIVFLLPRNHTSSSRQLRSLTIINTGSWIWTNPH